MPPRSRPEQAREPAQMGVDAAPGPRQDALDREQTRHRARAPRTPPSAAARSPTSTAVIASCTISGSHSLSDGAPARAREEGAAGAAAASASPDRAAAAPVVQWAAAARSGASPKATDAKPTLRDRPPQHVAHEPLGERKQLGVDAAGPLGAPPQLASALVLHGGVAPHRGPGAAPQRHVPRQAGHAQRLDDTAYVSISRSTSASGRPRRARPRRAPPEQLQGAVLDRAGAGDDLVGHVLPVGDVVGAGLRVASGGERDSEGTRVAEPPGHRSGGVGEVSTARLAPVKARATDSRADTAQRRP